MSFGRKFFLLASFEIMSIQYFKAGSGTFLAKGGMKPTYFQLVFPREPYNIFQHLMQLTYLTNVCIFKQNQPF